MIITDYILGECLVLIPALNILGQLLKGTQKINVTCYIPLLLLVCGLTGCFALKGLHADAALQGVFVTGAAVYGHQLLKQLKTSAAADAD
jgi:hypothetical protein